MREDLHAFPFEATNETASNITLIQKSVGFLKTVAESAPDKVPDYQERRRIWVIIRGEKVDAE